MGGLVPLPRSHGLWLKNSRTMTIAKAVTIPRKLLDLDGIVDDGMVGHFRLLFLLLLFPSSSSFNDTIAYVHDNGATILSTYILITVLFMQRPVGRPVVRVVSSKFVTRQHYGSFHSH